jgi:hypothetical protein
MALMSMAFESEEDEIKARDILLRHYSSECVAHGAHILTWLIAIFTFVQAAGYFEILRNVVLDIAILSLFFAGLIYSVGRLSYWSYLTTIVVSTPVMGESEAVKYFSKFINVEEDEVRRTQSINILFRLSCSLSDKIGKCDHFMVKFFGSSRGVHGLRNTIVKMLAVWLVVFGLLAFVYLVTSGTIKFAFN